MTFSWQLIIDLGIISLALLVATLLRAKISFFQKYLIPNSLTAGFLLLPFYNYLAPELHLSADMLGNLVYHLLAISFIAMSLRKTIVSKEKNHTVLSTAVSILMQYGVQAFLGFALALLLAYTLLPALFPGIGLFLPLGYALGPGQAFAIGSGWEKFGLEGGGSIGLTFGALGFIWSSFAGIAIINLALKKGWIHLDKQSLLENADAKRGIYSEITQTADQTRYSTEPEAIDPFTYNVAYVLGTYILSYVLLQGLTLLLTLIGPQGKDLAWNLWGIHFVFAALTAQLVKQILIKARIDYTLDNIRLTRISGLAVDIMVAASLGAISLVAVYKYWIPIAIISTIGGVITTATHIWLASRLFKDHIFLRMILVYGAITGTLPTGLALLRVLDPDFESPAASDYMLATGFVFVLAIPLILTMNLPAYGFARQDPFYYWITLTLYGGFLLLILGLYWYFAGRDAWKQASRFWYPTKKNQE